MILDKEEHREALLQLLAGATVPGSAIDLVYDLKQAIVSAIVRPRIEERRAGFDLGGNQGTGVEK